MEEVNRRILVKFWFLCVDFDKLADEDTAFLTYGELEASKGVVTS